VYRSWQDWLDHEKLPACTYCAPKDGVYKANSENEVELSFHESVACSFGSHAVDVLDGTSRVLSVGATAVGIASLFTPIAGPILHATALTANTAGAYGTGRSIYELTDRSRHNQSVSLADREARGHWLSIVGNSLSLGLKWARDKLFASVAASGTARRMVDPAAIVFSAARIGCRGTDCLKILHACESLLHSAEKADIDPLLTFQLTASVLFFTHDLLRFQNTCNKIREVHGQILEIRGSNGVHHVCGLSGMGVDRNVDQSFEVIIP